MPGMLGMQPAGHKKVQTTGFFDISQQQSNADTSNPSNTLEIDFQKHDNAGDVSQFAVTAPFRWGIQN